MSPLHRRRTAESIVFALVVSTFLLSAARADEPGFKPIFNGKDLTGWRLGYTELAGKTASDDGRFAVKDGILVITGSKDTPPKMAEIDTVGVVRRRLHPPPGIPRLPGREQRPPPAGQGLRTPAPDPRLPAGRPVQDAQELQGRRLERDRGGRHRHQGPLHLQRRAARGRPRYPRQRAARPAIRDQRGRIPEHPDQAGGHRPGGQARHPLRRPAHERQVLDVYSPPGAKDRPVVFWIHGGGWQTGDKSSVQLKPRAFTDKGFVFVSTNYRLLPHVDMATIVRDIAKSIRWVHDHIAEYGGDPERLLVMGHSAGAQLAALVCIDDRYLKAEGLSLAIIKGCVPVDGDTYDVPAIIETAETRRRVHGLPQAKYGHREKFGNDPAKHRDFSAVTHVARDKGIPPFLIMHVAEHPDTSAQAQRLAGVLKGAGVPVRVFGARESTHNKINADLGLPDDPGTKALFEFVDEALKK